MKIVSYIGIENNLQLLSPENKLLDEFPKLKNSINNVIQGKIFQYNNRILKPEQLESYFDYYYYYDTIFDKREQLLLNTPDDFLMLYEYCTRHKLSSTLVISYMLESLADTGSLNWLISRLRLDTSVKLFIDLSKTGTFSTEEAMKNISHLRSSVEGIQFGMEVNSLSKIDIQFPSLKYADIGDYLGNEFNSLRDTKLERLSVYKSSGSGMSLDLDQLPSSLKVLHISDMNIAACSSKTPTSLPQLEYLSLSGVCCESESAARVTRRIIHHLTTTVREFEWIPADSSDFTDVSGPIFSALVDRGSFSISCLRNWSRSGRRHLNWSCLPNLKKLSIKVLRNYLSRDACTFPSSLEEINISGGEFTNVTSLVEALPSKMRSISIESLRQTIYLDAADFSRFTWLTSLNLSMVKLGEEITFPDLLVELDLSNMNMKSYDDVTFPKSLKSLNISYSGLTSIARVPFPESLESLDITGNMLKTLDDVKFPKSLQLLNASCTKLTSFCRIDIPPTLKVLLLDENKLKEIDLSSTLEGEPLHLKKLDLKLNMGLKMNDVKLPSSVEAVDFTNCAMNEHIDVQYPASVESLNLSYNHLHEVSAIFPQDSHLKDIDLARNNAVCIDIKFPASVEFISLAQNELDHIPLCVRDLPNLRSLDISWNCLSNLTCEFDCESLQFLDLEHNMISQFRIVFKLGKYSKLPAINFEENHIGYSDTIYVQREGEKVILSTKAMVEEESIGNSQTFTLTQIMTNAPEVESYIQKSS
ncbi:hypothetical protein I9W82_004691 [Candida metapsilosis]|uniref:Uncharacterized protein n=1 Tax=Candida metapsilosis TaxID=273372 RepID=A0A8H7Z852_9ASCO|nr:hypothetical protein I9W82_004691 [Candida metapsilosis]